MNLEEAIDSICKSYPQKALAEAAAELSERYRHKQAHTTELQRIAYVATRLPATYAVLRKVFSQIEMPSTILDCGGGPGTSIWALLDYPVDSLTLIEQDPEFVRLGKKLSPETPFSVTWKTGSFLNLIIYPVKT